MTAFPDGFAEGRYLLVLRVLQIILQRGFIGKIHQQNGIAVSVILFHLFSKLHGQDARHAVRKAEQPFPKGLDVLLFIGPLFKFPHHNMPQNHTFSSLKKQKRAAVCSSPFPFCF